MREDLGLRVGADGRVGRHLAADGPPRPHRHRELECDLVVRGSASYLLGDRRHELTPGTLTWLFPGQDHVLVDESAGHELWWAVFRGGLVARAMAGALARTAGLSPSHLSRIFRAQTGVSITRFRNQRRLERFMALYGDGRRTTALAAALDAGFGSYAQFYRVLRAETGRTPTTLRRER